MNDVIFTEFPLKEKTSCGLPIPHAKWFRAQFRYFKEDCKLRREKKIEDFILNNNISKIHLISDNPILESFLENSQTVQRTSIELADMLVITDQRFSRLTTNNIINSLKQYLDKVPMVYLCLNKHYINYNDAGLFDQSLPDNYDTAITVWLKNSLSPYTVHNISSNFDETGAKFTWVLPPCEYLICKN